ncbi:MAG: arginase family protein [Promethearchaeota archaeon]|nr:MAG: arginase family protein [Candidatus Lokiarchaeota archaeon]
MSFQYKRDYYGTYADLAINPENLKEADVVIQGVPFESATSGKKGTSFAINSLRQICGDLLLISRRGVSITDMKICDVGNVPVFPLDAEATRDSVENSIKYLLSKSSAPIITIGGDHSITYPEIKGLSSLGTVGIIWFDAHRDLLDYMLSSRYSHGSALRRSIELNAVDPKNILLIGTRFMEPEEQLFVETHNINELSQPMLEDAENPRELVKEKIKEISNNVDYLFISIDIDCLDPAHAPGTGTPVGGGMTTSQLMNYIWDIPAPFRALDIVEASPPLDVSGITIKVVLALLTEIIAKIKLHKK